ncbi:hypothetical protein CFC21_057569 [Triticum aestivum]|uniref:DUF1618 domain-containing protein n=2 Tax=Triticum aestivum TaxID=4565 RepID=A0A3B6IP36_WHEAT|nr:uncharacterized protein LOC123092106 isoform X1 [Triticum aestivum]KAF7048922.1 hypothetical protein CFC21_057569 [Triticum aestivum]
MEKSRQLRGPSPADDSYRHHQPSAEKFACSRIPWVMLDRFAHRTKGDGDGVVSDAVADGTLSEISATCTGKPIAISLRVAEPPEVSRLYLHWPDGLRPEMSDLNKPFVIAAHGDSILFQTYVPLDGCYHPTCYPIDYFVYTAPSCSKSRSSLRRLPTCFDGGLLDPVMNQYNKPHLSRDQQAMCSADIGLLCHRDGGFTVANLAVADLTCLGRLRVLHYTPLETNMKWDDKELPLPCDVGTLNIVSGSWQTDTVIPFDDHYLCWVDLYLGLLFVDVIAKHPPPPRYARLPVELDQHRLYIDHGAPDPARHVCVTDAGIMKLISINDDTGRSVRDQSCSAFNITTWTFDLGTMRWHKEFTIKSAKFWAALDTDKRLPCLLPKFPTISLVDPNVICFTLEDSYNNFWLVEVNTKNKVLGAVALSIST